MPWAESIFFGHSSVRVRKACDGLFDSEEAHRSIVGAISRAERKLDNIPF
jgi:hypothetical protein